MTYKGVVPCALVRLGGLVHAQCATLMATVPRQSSRAICSSVTHAVAPNCLARLLCKIGHCAIFLFLHLFLSSLFLSSPCGSSIGDFGVLSPILGPRCHKSTPWVSTPIVLSTHVILTISFCCILKFSIEWTYILGIWDESNVIMISMMLLCCMND
jgi:hypothetical protein